MQNQAERLTKGSSFVKGDFGRLVCYSEKYFLFLFSKSLSRTESLLCHLQTDFRTMKTALCRILILMEQMLIKQNGGFF